MTHSPPRVKPKVNFLIQKKNSHATTGNSCAKCIRKFSHQACPKNPALITTRV
jgi:hypothetical protein